MVSPERPAPKVALPPLPQAVWGDLAVVNFTCGGAGTGAVLGILAVSLLAPVSGRTIRAVEIVGLLLAGAGLAAVAAEAGRPLRGVNVLRHLRRSWMSREALAAAIFGACIGLDVVLPGPWQRGAGAAAALAFMVSQGFILFGARGVPAWATWEVPVLFVTSGVTKGLGVVLVALAVLDGVEATTAAAGLATAVLLLGHLAWVVFVGSQEGTAAKQKALAALRTRWVAAGIVGLGHLLPLVTLVVILGSGGPSPGTQGWAITGLVGLCMLAGGALLKWVIVRRAGLLHPLGLNVLRSIGRPVVARTRPGSAMGPWRS